VRGAGARRLAALAPIALAAAAPAAAESPRVLYMLHCQGCHLADGAGKPGEVPSLVGTLGRFPAVPGGRAYLVQVPGSAHSPLSDAALASVLNWMVASFGSPADGSGFVPYDAAEVARYRATPLVDVAATRAELLRRMDGD
jgi:mono/diheme cytochrome c family protein